VITAIDAEAGHVVQAGQVVVHIAEHGEREIEVSVPESRVEELRHAASLSIQLWADASRRYTGRLRELAPNTDAVTRTYAARVSVLDADAALGLGMTAKLVLGLDAGEGLRKLPLTALYDTGGTPQVWIVDRKTSRVEARALRVARMQKDAVLVREGLNEGDVVVTAGAHLLHAGQKVRLADSQTTTEG
jgi:RND family efflux transporter MFP subunit